MEGRRILVAVDESEESIYALSWCLHNLLSTNTNTNTNTNNTSLFLLYVKPPPPAYSSLDATGYLFGEDVIGSMEKYGKDLVNSVMDRAETICRNFQIQTHYVDQFIKIEKKVGCGDAKNVICVAVDKLKADILVMGSHDYGFFKRAILGSVSEYCAKHVKCPMVVVKRPKGNNYEDSSMESQIAKTAQFQY